MSETKGKWKIEHSRFNGNLVTGENDQLIAECEKLANAEHIVRCVNERPELIAALELLIKEVDAGQISYLSVLINAEEVLAKAKGEL